MVIPSDGTTSAPYVGLLNTYGAHPNAAKLLLEYVLSDEGQVIQAKKYARPIRDDVVLPPDIEAAFPPAEAYAAVKPITDWVQAATIARARGGLDHPRRPGQLTPTTDPLPRVAPPGPGGPPWPPGPSHVRRAAPDRRTLRA